MRVCKTHRTDISYLLVKPLTLNVHRCIGAIKFVTNNVVGVLNPWHFPLLLFEVFELVTQMED